MLELTAINSSIQETDNDFMEQDDNSLFLFTTHFIETKFTTDRTRSTELKNLSYQIKKVNYSCTSWRK